MATDVTVEALSEDVAAFIDAPGDDNAFDALAMRVLACQCAHFPIVRKQVERASPSSWRELPGVPVGAFKALDLFAGATPARVFRSSGTTGSTPSRACFSATGLALMDRAITRNAGVRLFADGRATRIVALAPPPELAPHMIMVYGLARLMTEFGLDGSRFVVGAHGLDRDALHGALAEAADAAVPLTLVGASFAFVHFLDSVFEPLRCAPGSRALDAGGFKGKSRELTRDELVSALAEKLAITRSTNLLGMTELASQWYDVDDSPGCKRGPPWTRTRVLDPMTLNDAAPGALGLLWHLDLANVERPMAVLTDDLGIACDGGFRIVGRARGAEAKGCSLTVDDAR